MEGYQRSPWQSCRFPGRQAPQPKLGNIPRTGLGVSAKERTSVCSFALRWWPDFLLPSVRSVGTEERTDVRSFPLCAWSCLAPNLSRSQGTYVRTFFWGAKNVRTYVLLLGQNLSPCSWWLLLQAPCAWQKNVRPYVLLLQKNVRTYVLLEEKNVRTYVLLMGRRDL